MAMLRSAPRLVAVLGPTNTGKTHFAIERMLDHPTGMIGFPLRLLARENYDRIVKLRGARAVALITGEEKILPPNPSYFVCTVESMPLDRPVEFLAVDEIQLCADPERGHVFTARLLHARGTTETMFLGADTIRPLMRRLVPKVEYISRPRFSTLAYTGHKKVTRLPRRSAVVAFSLADVFSLAELVRRQRGGTAVVLGALSPRARNAQVGMFQAGEVDYLVATDAIGMGLNMDLDHVAFARLAKFDGRGPRRLSPAEIGQIAGRAGRHMADGTFGTTADEGLLEPEIVSAVEEHRFEPLTRISWRNSNLRFNSVGALLHSLDERPPAPGLVQVRDADDHRALQLLSRNTEVVDLATNPGARAAALGSLPDPRFPQGHERQPCAVSGALLRPPRGTRASACRAAWVGDQMAQLDRLDGDIDTLMARIAHIRTWTYITHRSEWIEGAADWQERARGIEDRLSDALHDRITQRFVDRRSAFLVRHLAGAGELLASVDKEGEVRVEGTYVGRLRGFHFVPDAADGEAMRTLITAANRVLRSEVGARARRLAGDDDDAFTLDAHGEILWQGGPVGRLTAGETMLAPRVEVRAGDFLEGEARERVRQRLQAFVRGEIERRLAPLFAAQALPLSGPARGIAFQLSAALGVCPGRGRRARRSNRSTGQAAGRWRGWACGSEPRQSMSSRCSAPMRSASGRCFGRYGTAERRRSCRADAAAARRSRSIRTSRCHFMPRSGAGSLPDWRCGRTGSSDWRRRPATARGLGLLPPMRNWPHWAASLPTRCAGFCWRSAIAPLSKGIASSLSPSRADGRPTSESADAPPPPAATIRLPNSRS